MNSTRGVESFMKVHVSVAMESMVLSVGDIATIVFTMPNRVIVRIGVLGWAYCTFLRV